MSDMHPTDSLEIANLRLKHRYDYQTVATPYRLGRYATMHGITIRDYGAHSQRWITMFNRGKRDEMRGVTE